MFRQNNIFFLLLFPYSISCEDKTHESINRIIHLEQKIAKLGEDEEKCLKKQEKNIENGWAIFTKGMIIGIGTAVIVPKLLPTPNDELARSLEGLGTLIIVGSAVIAMGVATQNDVELDNIREKKINLTKKHLCLRLIQSHSNK